MDEKTRKNVIDSLRRKVWGLRGLADLMVHIRDIDEGVDIGERIGELGNTIDELTGSTRWRMAGMTNKQTRGMAVRQDIATWYTPEEKRPPENETVVITFNGPRHIHALGCGAYCEDEGWLIYGMNETDRRLKCDE